MTSAQPKPPIEDPHALSSAIPNRPFPLKRVVGTLLAIAIAVAAAAVLLPKPAEAKDVIGLNAGELKEVTKIEDYLNAISTMKARFVQITDKGQFAKGQIWMERPGRIRIDYDPPTPLLIVSNGTLVMYKDEELDQLSYVPLSSIPAAMFIKDHVNFSGDDLLITDYVAKANTVRLTLQRAADPQSGSLTLVFETHPMQLKKWAVLDAQGVMTTVSLVGTRFGEKLSDDLFHIENRAMQGAGN